MTSDVKLPPYSESLDSKERSALGSQSKATRIAGNVQTCSIKDLQSDYLKIVCESPTSYYICLTVDPTPIYTIKFVSDSKVGDVQIFWASEPSQPPVAAARLSPPNTKRTEAVAMICCSEPHLPDAHWTALIRSTLFSMGEDYRMSIPVVTAPGLAPTPCQFGWRTGMCDPLIELWWDSPLPYSVERLYSKNDRDSRYLFATGVRGTPEKPENLIEMRRGAGMEFEMTVVLGFLAILHQQNRQLA